MSWLRRTERGRRAPRARWSEFPVTARILRRMPPASWASTPHGVEYACNPAAVPHTGGVRVLVVDDDPSVRESLRRSLAFNGYDVLVADDGIEALRLVGDEGPDALVLDVMMPKLDGLQACRALRAAGNDVPILLLTARDAVADRVAGLDAGADDYLPKPFALEELLARLRALLRRVKQDDDADEVLS